MRKILPLLLLALFVLPCGCSSNRRTTRGRQLTERTSTAKLSPQAHAVVMEAQRWIGTPYRYGKQQRKSGTDCSGMVMTIFEHKADIQLPRNSARQQMACTPVSRNDLQPADLVFFTSSSRGGKVSHVGIYTGNGHFIHASSSRGVIESSLEEPYYRSHYHSAGRVGGMGIYLTDQPGPEEQMRMAQQQLDSIITTLIDSLDDELDNFAPVCLQP